MQLRPPENMGTAPCRSAGASMAGAVVPAGPSGNQAMYGSSDSAETSCAAELRFQRWHRGRWNNLPSNPHSFEIGGPPLRASLATAGMA